MVCAKIGSDVGSGCQNSLCVTNILLLATRAAPGGDLYCTKNYIFKHTPKTFAITFSPSLLYERNDP